MAEHDDQINDIEEEEDYTPDLISLVDEDGVEHQFEIADVMEVDDNQYMALIPIYDDPQVILEDDGELMIFRVSSDGEEYLEAIEDEKEFKKVADLFTKRLEELYDIVDQ